MKAIAAALALLTLAACTPPRYQNPGVHPQTFARDDYECERDARSIRGDVCVQIRMYMRCMESKGHQRVPNTGAPC